MSAPRAGRAVTRLAAQVVVAAVALATLTGCVSQPVADDLQQALATDGFTAPQVRFRIEDNKSDQGEIGDVVEVRSSGHPGLDDAAAGQRAVRLLWTTVPRRLYYFTVAVGSYDSTRDTANGQWYYPVRSLGPRPSGLDARTAKQDVRDAVTGAGLAGVVVLAALAVVVVRLVRRRVRTEVAGGQ